MANNQRRVSPLCVLLICALASATVVVYTVFPASLSPCAYSLSRTLLAVTGLDSYAAFCTDEATTPELLSDGGGRAETLGGGPIVTELLQCGRPKLPAKAIPPYQCCPPVSASEPVKFTLPDASEPLRTRRPAHAAGADHMAKYERAVALMKALPRSDPRSFYQQANVHCAYCTGAYRQVGHPELAVQIHFSWFFFPFHRAYLYFFERIAGKLLGDPGFALPFWSWDVPEGMRMPLAFANVSSPLYDPLRNPRHAPPKLVDLDFSKLGEKNLTDEQQIQHNLRIMYKQMISNAPLASLFYGQPFRAGQADKPGAGTVEIYPHNTMHTWTGDISLHNVENMGVYYSAGRDPIFYPYHSNIDRLWEIWRDTTTVSGRHGHAATVFTDPDWLDSSFLFYDEEARLVRITVRDVLDIDRLRYAYDDDGAGTPWLDARPPPTPDVNRERRGELPESVRFPVLLNATVTTPVRRPSVLRRVTENVDLEEVLVVDGIVTDGTSTVKFDVFVNAREHEKVELGGREMAGSFVCLKHHMNDGENGEGVETTMRLALSEILKDLGAEEDESVAVTLVPRYGNVRIGGLRIEYIVGE
ncbi:polyphenol oxidase, chloroplastic-like [Oryza brachyantha]|uniref:Tyrosinase copper-binding domain-containing protein n=1 Tax=Oryza brachyantha TaxID=4533 RepID=J3L4U3_ORYBR|nr:polyphenol oxidase, chloroplastic-like [Oryza brachyantha]